MGADLQDSFEDENKINNKHYQIKFLKNTGILVLFNQRRYHKINLNSEQIQIKNLEGSSKFMINTSNYGQKPLEFSIEYEELVDPDLFYRNLIEWQLEIEEKKNKNIKDFSIMEN